MPGIQIIMKCYFGKLKFKGFDCYYDFANDGFIYKLTHRGITILNRVTSDSVMRWEDSIMEIRNALKEINYYLDAIWC
jgi:hypothetical protein